jgi:hypothetical protein
MSTATVVAPMELSTLQKLGQEHPPELVQKIHDILEKKKDEELKELAEKIREENKKTIDLAIKELQEKMEPPKQEDIQRLLDQELIEFTLNVPGKNGDKRKFVIRELPQKIEKKIVRLAKEKLVPIATDLTGLTMNLLEGNAAQKLENLMNALEPALDVLTDICAVVLDPYGEEKIDKDWVQDNLTTKMIGTVVVAQFEANRLRDFFLLLSRGMSSIT